MNVTDFPCTIRLIRLMAPSLLMALSTLTLIDSFNAFLDPDFRCIQINPSNAYFKLPKKDSLISNTKEWHHNELKTAIVFLFEVFSGIINFLTGGIYLLLTFCCIITKQTVDQTVGRRIRVPFPKKTDGNYPMELVSFIEFSSFLTAVAGTFGALMMITTMSLRYRSPGGNLMDFNFIDDVAVDQNSTGTGPSSPLCHIHRTSGLTNAILMLCVDIVLVIITILSRRLPTGDDRMSTQLENWSRSKADEYSLLHNSNIRAKKFACFCLDLTRLILMLASILITCGGLNVLGGVLQLLQAEHTGFTFGGEAQIRPRIKEVSCIANGILSLCCGLLAVTSIHCCSTPLEVLFSEVYQFTSKCEPRKFRFGRFTHLLTMSVGLVTLPLSTGAYVLLRIDFRDYSQDNLDSYRKSVPLSAHTSEVLHVGYTLSCFASLIAFLVCSVLMICLLVDIYIRIKLMDYRPSLVLQYHPGNHVDPLQPPGCGNQTMNHCPTNWKFAKSLSLQNAPSFNCGNLYESGTHLDVATVQGRAVNALHNDTMTISRNYLTVHPSLAPVTTPFSMPVLSESGQVRTDAWTHATPDLACSPGEVKPRLPGPVASNNYHQGQQNQLTYTCKSNGNNDNNGVQSIESPATTATQASQPKENPEYVCEYMSCDIDLYPESIALAEKSAEHSVLPNGDTAFVGEPHHTVWYYDLAALGEGTFTSV